MHLHSDGRTVMSLVGNRVATGGISEQKGPITWCEISEDGRIEVVRGSTELASDDGARTLAVALQSDGKRAAIVEGSGGNIAVFELSELDFNGLVAAGSDSEAVVRAMTFSKDDQTL